jgi:hypothetical protein
VAFEAETPIRLSRFFDRWILGATVPTLRVTSRVAADGTSADIHVEQQGEIFDLPLTIQVQYADGHTELVTIPVTDATVDYHLALKGPIHRIVTRDPLTLATVLD